ncbi:methionine ABC transporter permease [Phaeovibrio sulfidiphilus]|nr:methionine ABC transporter permease [Phaeovibrio sulfidiphilus]
MSNLVSALLSFPAGVVDSLMRNQDALFPAFGETLYMVGASTVLSFALGFFLAVVMILSGPKGLNPAPRLYSVLDIVVDLGRSLPFIILIIAIMPFTRLVMGTAIGTTATILPLTVAAAPFAARLIEANFLEVDRGVIEAARSFGATNAQIVFRVLVPEALPAIALNVSVLGIALVGYSAMAGTVGGGGLGDLAYRLGYVGYETDVTLWCVILLVALVTVIQKAGNLIYSRLRPDA